MKKTALILLLSMIVLVALSPLAIAGTNSEIATEANEDLIIRTIGDFDVQMPSDWLYAKGEKSDQGERHYFYGSGVNGDVSDGYAFITYIGQEQLRYGSWGGRTNWGLLHTPEKRSDFLDNYINMFTDSKGTSIRNLQKMEFNEREAAFFDFSMGETSAERLHGTAAFFYTGQGFAAMLISSTDNKADFYTLLRQALLDVDDLDEAIVKEEEVEPEKEEKQIWRKGMMKVGADIPAGTYLMVEGGWFYFEVTSDSTGSFESILANGNPENREYIELQDGQYIKTTATFHKVGDGPELPEAGNLPTGTYLVGLDIAAGEYLIEAKRDTLGYVAILNGVTHQGIDGIVMNDNFEGARYITVYDGQYLQLSGCELVR